MNTQNNIGRILTKKDLANPNEKSKEKIEWALSLNDMVESVTFEVNDEWRDLSDISGPLPGGIKREWKNDKKIFEKINL